jgi:ABC-type multidrug transport system fused ATPase/permease subunit
MLFLRFIISVYWSRNASHRLHKDIMAKLVRATTTFYDVTPMGRLLTRISKDIAMIDQMLSNQFDTTVNMVFNLLGTFAQMATSSPYILIIVGVAVIVFYFLQAYYRKTSIEIQRLESISRAPILGHLSETLEGAQNIRAYGMERNFKYANFNKIDDNTVDFLALRYSSMWFGLRLDFLGTCIIFATFLSIILLRNLNPAALTVSLAGLAMSSTTGITFMLSALSMNMAELETRMNSVERIQQYTKIEQEAPAHIEETAPPASWPEKGEIKFKGLSIAYNGGPKVLKQLSIKIRPREKVGIVGRTGAGKSTLITALFRLVEFVEGTAFIDGVDISKIGLDDLRRKISIIPQMPQLFIGTVRYNVDPFAAATDDQIWKALEMVQLKDYIASLDGKLEAQIDEGGANLSVGQRQLLSMARALLVNAHILLLDEATASADSETDAVIQRMIRREFNDKTILCIAHRLNTIMDYDRIVVMSAGEVVEYDTPANLLKNPDGVFTSMVNATGEASAAHLKKIANGEINVVEDIKAEAQKEKAKRDKKQNGSSNGSKPKKSSSKKIKEIIESSSDESSS